MVVIEYFIKGTSHFFNLFANFLEHCENVIYFLLFLIFAILIIFTLKNNKNFKNNLWCIIKSYFHLFKFPLFTILSLLSLIISIIVFTLNNEFKILSLLVLSVNYIKQTISVYDDKLFNNNNQQIFKKKDFSNILVPNLILIFFKITYWSELYTFNINKIKSYFIVMLFIIIVEIVIMFIFKLYSIYSQVFKFVKPDSNYNTFFRIVDLLKILNRSNNNIEYFKLVRIFLQSEKISMENHNEIIYLCLYYKSIKNKIKIGESYKYNYEIYNDFINSGRRIGGDHYE